MTLFLLKISLCWAFFALLYRLLLRQETFFRANRLYLLGTSVLGIVLAAWPAESLPVYDAGILTTTLPVFTVGMQQVAQAANTWEQVDFWWILYWLGVGITLLRLVWGLFRIAQMAVRGQTERLDDGCCLVHTTESAVPFSFFRWVFVPQNHDYPPESEASHLMLAHERAHARGWHSADVLFSEFLCAFFWFHPLAHWYRKALRNVHEYLADADAARQADRKQYGLLLIGQSQSGMSIAFVHHFFQSPLKQRLIMLTKKNSAPLRVLKFGLVAPAALLFALLFRQAPAIAQAVDEQHQTFVRDLVARNWVVQDTVVTFDPDTYVETVQIIRGSMAPALDADGKLVYQYAEVQPQFPGGEAAMMQFLSKNVQYPTIARQNKVEGTVSVTFVVDENGNILRPFGQINMPNDTKQPLIEEAIRVVQSMPRWTPAQFGGKPVRCSMRLPVNFQLAGEADKTASANPEFLGGMEALMQFLAKNVQYPETAKKENAAGMVLVQFIITEDGSLTEIKPVMNDQTLHPDLVKEAIRVVQTMPKWKPGIQDGKVVRAQFTLPIKFKLDGEMDFNDPDLAQMPEFPGGMQAFYTFLTKNILYPEAAKKAGMSGMAVVSFIIEANGELSTFEVLKTPHADLSDELIRVLKLSPKWTAGMKDGKAVRVKYKLPFRYELSDK